MACCELQRVESDRECHFDQFYQAIENYDVKSLVREAENRRILTRKEKDEIEQQKSRSSMRKRLVKLILQREVQEQEQFSGFIEELFRRGYENARRLVTGFQRQQTNTTIDNTPRLSQLSQDSLYSSSAGSTSPMECDQMQQDGGYFSTSQPLVPDSSLTQPSYTNLDSMEEDLRYFQETHNPLQTFVTNKMQRSQAAMNSPPPASLSGQSASRSGPGTVHIVNNHYTMVFNNTISKTNPGFQSDEPGTHMLEYPGTTPRVQSYEPLESTDWSRCLKEHHRMIIEYLNVNSLLPHLNEKCLLTPSENEVLYSMHMTPREQARYLLRILPGKGKDGFKLFLECLRDEKDHLGHKDLAKCLGLSSQTPIAV